MTTHFLTEDQIMSTCPAAFSKSKHSRLKDSYGFVRTIDVAREMQKEGWECTMATQVRSDNEERMATNRHLMRFRHINSKPIVGDSHPEILLMNSHSGATGFFMNVGLYRMVCSNGLVVADSTFETRRYRHHQNVSGEIIEGTCEVIDSIKEIENGIKKYNGLLIDQSKREEFARRVLEFSKRPDSKVDYKPNDLIKATRQADNRPSLWNTYNIVQEKIISGGAEGTTESGRKTRFRGITAPRKNVEINQKMWQAMDDFYQEIKAA